MAPWGGPEAAALNTDAAHCAAAGGNYTRKALTAEECGASYAKRCFSWDGEPSLRAIVEGACPRCLPDMSEAIRPRRGYTWTPALYTRNKWDYDRLQWRKHEAVPANQVSWP